MPFSWPTSWSVQMCGWLSAEIARFAIEALAQLRVRRERLRQNLDRDRAIESGIAGAVDFAHSTCADRRDDFVRSEPRASFERHRTGEL
jgi:hypothetical protein